MRPIARVLLLACAIALQLGACTSIDFDPGELLAGDFFNTKKPLPGERKAVFPEGVPGVSRGVPSELMKGQSQLVSEPEPVVASQPVAVVEEPKARPKAKAKPKPKPTVAARPPAEPQQDDVWPEPPRQQPPRQQPPPQRPQPQQQQVQWPDSPPPRQQPQVQWPDPPSRPQSQPQVQWPDPPAPR